MISILKYKVKPRDRQLNDVKNLIKTCINYGAKNLDFHFDQSSTYRDWVDFYKPLLKFAKSLKLDVNISFDASKFSLLYLLIIFDKNLFLNVKHLDDSSTLELPKSIKQDDSRIDKSKGLLIRKSLLVLGLMVIAISMFNLLIVGYHYVDYLLFENKISESNPNNIDNQSSSESHSIDNVSQWSNVEIQNYLQKQQDLSRQSKDYFGWISVDDSDINFPIVKGEDNQYYLDHDYLQNQSVFGSIYVDFRVHDYQDNYLVVYGHSVHYKQMFGLLNNYQDPAYFESHPTIRILLPNEIRTYRVFSVQLIDADTTTVVFPKNQIELNEQVKTMISNSLHKPSFELNIPKQIITLVSCEYSQDNGRIFVSGILIKTEEIYFTAQSK